KGKKKRPNRKIRPREKGKELFLFFIFFLIALFAHLVLFRCFFTTFVRAFLALCDGFVAAGSILLTLFANLMFFVRFDATFVVAFLAFGLCLNATALARKDAAGANHKSEGERYARKRFGNLHFVPF